ATSVCATPSTNTVQLGGKPEIVTSEKNSSASGLWLVVGFQSMLKRVSSSPSETTV
ncbi:hypothetical protein D049_1281B, partial [Vibrio parahaemolyticus VPTS-2010]